MATRAADAIDLAPRAASLSGCRLGVLDNGKPNSDRFLDALAGELARDHDLADVVRARKPSIGKLAPDEVVHDLRSKCDVLLTGVGDCAGCCSCSAHDAITFERLGIPTAMVCTMEFLDAARAVARAMGLRDFPFTIIQHPLGSLTPERLDERATGALAHVTWTLTSADPATAPIAPALASADARAATTSGVDCAC